MTDTNTNDEVKKSIAIYRINTQLKDLIQENQDIWNVLQNKIKTSKYNAEEKSLKNDFLASYDSKCYKLTSSNRVSWKKYVDKFLETPLITPNSCNSSLLLLIKPKEQTEDIYAIVFGNLAYFAIQSYIDVNFGLDILSRIIEPDSNVVKSSKGQNVVGSTQGQLSIYRQLHSLSDIEDFGRIFQELNASVKKDVLEKFGISTDKNFKNCCAKSSFQIKTSILPETIEKYIQGCEYAKTLPAQLINSSRKLETKRDKELIEILKEKIIKQLWINLSLEDNIDLCHRDFDKYINAENYKCCYQRITQDISFETSLLELKNLFNIQENNFEKFLQFAKIISYDENDNPITQDKLLNHIFIEYEDNSNQAHQKYFMLNGDIYKLENTFIDSLNNKIRNYKKKNMFIELPNIKQWEHNMQETEYNNLYKNDINTIVIHPYKHKYIELCDFIKYDNENLYLFFVKDGFEGTIRDLSYQIFNTAKIIENDINSDCYFLIGFYNAFKNLYSTNIIINQEDFVNLFKTRSIKYIFSFRDKSNRELEKSPESFASNIAKFSLIDLVQKMNMIDNGSLKIQQIESV